MTKSLSTTLEFTLAPMSDTGGSYPPTILQGFGSGVEIGGLQSPLALRFHIDNPTKLEIVATELDILSVSFGGSTYTYVRSGLSESEIAPYAWSISSVNPPDTVAFQIYTSSQVPTSGVSFYDSTGAALTGYTWTGLSRGNSYSSYLDTPVVYGVPYTVNISKSVNDLYVTIETQISDGTPYRDRVILTKDLETINGFSFGKSLTAPSLTPVSSPNFTGSINLASFSATVDDTEYDTTKTVTTVTDTQDFVHFPYMPYHSYAAKNLRDMSDINVIDETFEGSEDNIDFSYSEDNEYIGFTLSSKIDIRNLDDKLFYVKRFGSGVYCSLQLINKYLTFTLNTEGSPVVLGYPISVDDFSPFTANPVLITITSEGSITDTTFKVYNATFKMYKNNELLLNQNYSNLKFLSDPEQYILYNYGDGALYALYAWTYAGKAYAAGEDGDPPSSMVVEETIYTDSLDVTSETILYNSDGTRYSEHDFNIALDNGTWQVMYTNAAEESGGVITKVSKPTEYSKKYNIFAPHDMYVSDIITFRGPISEDQLYYLTNITDTNF